MIPDHRLRLAFTLTLTIAPAAACVAHAQQGAAGGLPASAVMARGGIDGWQSRGGVVGPWWSGSSAGAVAPAADGGFWFGWPGLGFGGSQGATRGMGMNAPSVTTMPGAAGTVSSSRLVPFVTGVVPVVGSGAPLLPSTTAATLPWSAPPGMLPSTRLSPFAPGPVAASGGVIPARPSSPGGRARAQRLVTAGDRRLLEDDDGPLVARAALGDYRAAARSAQDDPDIQIRLAILHQAIGQSRDADRAIARATQIDGRLAATLDPVPPDAAGFHASAPPGIPAVMARGLAILREIAAADERPAGAPSPAPVLEWLEAAWNDRLERAVAAPVLRADRPAP